MTWGSGPKVAAGMTSRQLTGVRAGRHTCYDRLVIDLNGAGRTSAGYHVSYVSNVVEDGSGQVVPLRGGAKLAVVVRAPAYDGDGRPTYTPANRWELVNVTGFQTFRQLAFAGSSRVRPRSGSACGPGSDAGLPAGRPRHRAAAGDRRRPPVVRGVASGRGSACHERWTRRNQLSGPNSSVVTLLDDDVT